MANKKDKLVPKNPNEVVIPIGKANLVTTQEEIDEALKTASHIFRQTDEEDETMEESNLTEELQTSLEANETPVETETGEATEELVELSADELAALPHAKFGRDKYGRALNKDKTPRKGRADKGTKRGAYGPRTPKVEVIEVTQAEAALITNSE